MNLYRRGTGGACVGTLPLQQQDKGVWSIYLPGDQHGKYYDFTLATRLAPAIQLTLTPARPG